VLLGVELHKSTFFDCQIAGVSSMPSM
jgi:hypothetical protein